MFAQNGIPWWYGIGLSKNRPAPPDLSRLAFTALDKLYITTAWEGMNEQTRAQQPLSGGLFVCDNPGATGFPAVEFAG